MTSSDRSTERPPAPDPLPIAVVDNHCHLDIRREDSPEVDLDRVVAEAAAVGVDRLVQIGCELGSARWTVSILDDHPALLGGVAIHPNEAPRHEAAGDLDDAIDEIAALARHPRVRTIGETGLDYYRTGPEGVDAQHHSFRRHIALAKELGLALQVHDRDAHEDILRILAEEGAPERTVLHCFSGDMEMARECVRRGYYLSFAGTVTFKSAKGLRDALAWAVPDVRRASLEVAWFGVRARRPSGTPVVRRLGQHLTYYGALGGRGYLCAADLSEKLAERLLAGA